jgi:hypothetical protein
VPPFTQLELFSRGLKSMKVNFNIYPGQHNHRIWTSLNHSGQFWRLRVRNRFPPPTSLKQFEDVLQEEWYKIALETVQNLYWKQQVVQHHINKEMFTVSVAFPLFCSTPVYMCVRACVRARARVRAHTCTNKETNIHTYIQTHKLSALMYDICV